MPTTAEKLAREFSRALISRIPGADLAEIVRRNAEEPDPSICHSLDFVDANKVLREVFAQQGIVLTGEAEIERYSPLWDEAWWLARENAFWAEPDCPKSREADNAN